MTDESKQKPDSQPNALAAFIPKPELGLVGPTVNDDVYRAITRYGAEAVKEAVAEATKAKRGRKSTMNWKNIRSLIEEDAALWLDGGDPFSARSNYSIQKYYADNFPGQSHPATMKMVERHLRENRDWMTYATAELLSRDGYPYTAHIAALKALGECMGYSEYVSHEYATGKVAKYEGRYGSAPRPEMSMAEIEEELRKPERPVVTGILAPYANKAKD